MPVEAARVTGRGWRAQPHETVIYTNRLANGIAAKSVGLSTSSVIRVQVNSGHLSTYQAVVDFSIPQGLFPHYLEGFMKHMKPTKSYPVLLIVDNHAPHISIATVDYRQKNNMIMQTVPPHSSHMMQLLNPNFFSPFKAYCLQACENWSVSHGGRPITEAQTGLLVEQAIESAVAAETAIKRFSEGRIWPLTLKFTFHHILFYHLTVNVQHMLHLTPCTTSSCLESNLLLLATI
jgi:hypothetical protein